MYKMASKLGFADELCKNVAVNNDEPLIEDITREFNQGMWTIGYTGQSPERLKDHKKYRSTFNTARRRILRYAVAVLGYCRDETPRHTASV
jgi:formate dehydrogenase major subunit